LQAGVAVKSVPHSDAGGDAAQLPAAPGTYALVLLFPRARRVKIGRLGVFTFQPGWYVYVGSAFGPGGLRTRCQRHFRRTVQDRWHIDYLKKASLVKAVWFASDPVRREHQWAEIIGGLPEAEMPVLKFGSSDCSCPTHLFYFQTRPYPTGFRRAATRLLPANPSIHEFVS